MYPDITLQSPKGKFHQHGFLIPLAIFILVVMGFFAITIARITGQTAIATAQEAVTIASFYAAESGARYAMNQLFYDTASPISRVTVDANCTAVDSSNLTFTVDGLRGCSAAINCSRTADAANTTSYYRIQSQATCGSGAVSAERTVEISAYMK
ncbi:MAG: MSHA biogenesis protein MshP [Proteobacteria bacterium]|nr:MSHA biogenesis protein MshP [Pseudomonadota bacterium]